jgi:hypothetical protein
MSAAPFRMPLTVFTDHNAEPYTCLAVAAVAQLMETDHLGFSRDCARTTALEPAAMTPINAIATPLQTNFGRMKNSISHLFPGAAKAK